MKSYYKTISGIKYDKGMLEEADKSVAGKRDGRISMNDAKKIKRKALDGPGITEVELRTLNYIFDNYNFTPSAKDYFSTFLPIETTEATEVSKAVKDTKAAEDTETVRISPEEEAVETIEETVTEVKGFLARYYLLIIVILLAIFFLYLYSDRLYNFLIKDPETPVIVKIEDVNETDPEKDEVKVQQVPVAPVVPVAGENEYIIKEKDTLFDISSRIYGDPGKWKQLYERNKDLLEDPSMIYPGQKIRTDLK